MQVGDIVVPNKGHYLRSGCSNYECAVVVSMEPFILVSERTDMKWSCGVKPENFTVSSIANDALLERCKKRL